MSTIAQNISRIQQAKQDIITEIENKGVEVPSNAKINDLPQLVGSIPSGGGIESIQVNGIDSTTENKVAKVTVDRLIAGDSEEVYSSVGVVNLDSWNTINVFLPYLFYANNIYLGCSSLGIRHSLNGIDWSNIDFPVNVSELFYKNNTYLAAAGDTGVVCSHNGINWFTTSSFGECSYLGYCFDKFYVKTESKSNYGYIYSSVTGESSWTKINKLVTALYYGDQSILASFNDGMYCTTNGTDWTKVFAITGTVFYVNGLFIFNPINNIAVSSNGTNWTQSTYHLNFSAITGNSEVMVAASNTVGCFYSTDGLEWTQSDLPICSNYSGLCYGSNYFIIWGDGSLYKSSNGYHWELLSFDSLSSVVSIAYGNERFIVTGTGSSNYESYYTGKLSIHKPLANKEYVNTLLSNIIDSDAIILNKVKIGNKVYTTSVDNSGYLKLTEQI